jgi:cytochrome c556
MMMSKLPYTASLEGTDKGETRPSPKSGAESDKFARPREDAGRDGQAATRREAGNLDTIKAAFGTVGQRCKGCHDNFRKDAN